MRIVMCVRMWENVTLDTGAEGCIWRAIAEGRASAEARRQRVEAAVRQGQAVPAVTRLVRTASAEKFLQRGTNTSLTQPFYSIIYAQTRVWRFLSIPELYSRLVPYRRYFQNIIPLSLRFLNSSNFNVSDVVDITKAFRFYSMLFRTSVQLFQAHL